MLWVIYDLMLGVEERRVKVRGNEKKGLGRAWGSLFSWRRKEKRKGRKEKKKW